MGSGNINKLAITFSFMAVTAIFLSSCNKTGDTGNGGYKYPRNFPEECVVLYERWWVLLDKMKATGRFDEESLRKRNDDFSLSFIESFKNPPRERKPPMEEYVQACVTNQQTLDIWSRGIENIESKSDEELSKTLGVGGLVRQK